jgi:hypothetical protein
VFDQTFTAVGYDALLRADFAGFAHRAFCELNPRAEFAMNWHFEAIAARLDAVRQGRSGRLIINVPPSPEVAPGVDRLSGVVPGP